MTDSNSESAARKPTICYCGKQNSAGMCEHTEMYKPGNFEVMAGNDYVRETAERIGYKIQSLLTDRYTNSLKIAVGIIEQELRRRYANAKP